MRTSTKILYLVCIMWGFLVSEIPITKLHYILWSIVGALIANIIHIIYQWKYLDD